MAVTVGDEVKVGVNAVELHVCKTGAAENAAPVGVKVVVRIQAIKKDDNALKVFGILCFQHCPCRGSSV